MNFQSKKLINSICFYICTQDIELILFFYTYYRNNVRLSSKSQLQQARRSPLPSTSNSVLVSSSYVSNNNTQSPSTSLSTLPTIIAPTEHRINLLVDDTRFTIGKGQYIFCPTQFYLILHFYRSSTFHCTSEYNVRSYV